ncbi:ROK family protein [Micavibrio aeruginosavorus]|uniref:ROK family Glucokinase with ambiguous substrate specificity n=1 Tax=Micavibrio aeruginosavorus EPB TaxID=349215 RepID=M4VHJ2_9BACT|nr:ROK family protein [Micavibrio aeruginosavorus]AGH98678.1 ROK family Glucokinase with ambiguous substrate specificity [Micavibrio aeruginosavorus EPB]
MTMRIGIDLGGTKTEIICLDKNNGKELYRQRVPTQKGSYESTITTIRGLVEQAESTLGQTGTVGVGIPGTVSRDTGLVKNANSTWLIGKPLDKDLSDALGRPIRTENDANCLAVSEATDGAGAGKSVVFAVIIGTGCGAGIAVDGRAVPGINGIGGEWGHNPLPYPTVHNPDAQSLFGAFESAPGVTDTLHGYFTDDVKLSEYPGPLCYCGRRGCLETWISGTGFKNDYHRVTGDALSTHDIIAASKANEPKATAALHRYADRVARGLAGVINILDPDIVVLGGGMSNVDALYDLLPKIWGRYIFSDQVNTALAPARHGDSSGVRGAAWLWSRDEAA